MRVGVIDSPPFSLQGSGMTKGTYSVFASIFERNYEHTTSAPVIIIVAGQKDQ